MKVKDILSQDSVSISFEVFPPKKIESFDSVKSATEAIAQLHPDFMSVTYGAAGTTAGFTIEIAENLQNAYGVTVLPHFTCVSAKQDTVEEMIKKLEEDHIENIMVLRGDLPKDGKREHDFEHASDLIRFIKERTDLCIGGACYPEGHVESTNKANDIYYLKEKVDAGCDFLTTQMFFDNNILYNFLYRIREADIHVPVIAGIMPITTARQLERSVSLSGTNVPERFRAIVDHFGTNPNAMKQAGIIYASEQIIDLIANGITHIHVYTMNKPDVAEGILRNLSEIIK